MVGETQYYCNIQVEMVDGGIVEPIAWLASTITAREVGRMMRQGNIQPSIERTMFSGFQLVTHCVETVGGIMLRTIFPCYTAKHIYTFAPLMSSCYSCFLFHRLTRTLDVYRSIT